MGTTSYAASAWPVLPNDPNVTGVLSAQYPALITQVSEFKIAKIQSSRPFTHTPNAG